MKISKKNLLISLLYILFLISYYLILSNYKMGTKVSEIRYYLFFFVCIISLITVFFKKKLRECYLKKLLLVIPFGILLLLYSIFKAHQVGMPFSFRTIVQIFITIFPALYSFAIINIYDVRSIVKLMKITLIITIFTYFSSENHTLFSFFDYENWANLNLFSSTGNFIESALCSEVFLQLFFFFSYFRKINIESKEKNNIFVYYILSFVFTLLSFKRLAVLSSICFIIFDRLIEYKIKKQQKIKLKSKVKNKITLVTISILFCVIVILYTKFVSKEIFTNIDVFKFTTGRDYILQLWRNNEYFSYGYGTSMLVIGRYLEMDLVQIYLEMGVIILFSFTFVFFYIVNNNKYSYYIMFYAFINMLTASSLPYFIGWIITFVTIGVISSNKIFDEGYKLKGFIDKKNIKVD